LVACLVSGKFIQIPVNKKGRCRKLILNSLTIIISETSAAITEEKSERVVFNLEAALTLPSSSPPFHIPLKIKKSKMRGYDEQKERENIDTLYMFHLDHPVLVLKTYSSNKKSVDYVPVTSWRKINIQYENEKCNYFKI